MLSCFTYRLSQWNFSLMPQLKMYTYAIYRRSTSYRNHRNVYVQQHKYDESVSHALCCGSSYKGSIKHSPKRIKRLLGDCVMRFNIYGSGILNPRLPDGPGMPCSYEFGIL